MHTLINIINTQYNCKSMSNLSRGDPSNKNIEGRRLRQSEYCSTPLSAAALHHTTKAQGGVVQVLDSLQAAKRHEGSCKSHDISGRIQS